MDVFAKETAPLVVALGLTLAVAPIELAGLLFGAQPSALVYSALPDFDADVDGADLGPLSQSLSWLSFGKLPALVVIILLTATFGAIGFVGQDVLRRIIGFAIDPWIASVPAAFGAAIVTRHVGLALARIMPKEESDAVSTKAFVGRVATMFRGVAAEAEKAAATDRAEAVRIGATADAEKARVAAKGSADSQMLRAGALAAIYKVEAEGKRSVNEASNTLNAEQIAMQVRIKLIEALPQIMAESVKPMQNIDGIKILHVDGLNGSSQNGGGEGSSAGGGLADQAVAAALRYRSQAPLIDALMSELGLSGGTLDGLAGSVMGGTRPDVDSKGKK